MSGPINNIEEILVKAYIKEGGCEMNNMNLAHERGKIDSQISELQNLKKVIEKIANSGIDFPYEFYDSRVYVHSAGELHEIRRKFKKIFGAYEDKLETIWPSLDNVLISYTSQQLSPLQIWVSMPAESADISAFTGKKGCKIARVAITEEKYKITCEV